MPTNEELYDQADQLKESGQPEAAIEKLQELLAQDDSYALAHSALGVLYGRVGKHEDAVWHAERVCQLEPNDPFSFTAMSVIYQRAFAGTNDQAFIQKAEDAMAKAHMLQGQ